MSEIRENIISSELIVTSEYKASTVAITPPQKICLSHVLKNVATAIDLDIKLIENEGRVLTTTELSLCLHDTPKILSQTLAALNSGTFCPIQLNQCLHVAKYTGCDPLKDHTKQFENK